MCRHFKEILTLLKKDDDSEIEMLEKILAEKKARRESRDFEM